MRRPSSSAPPLSAPDPHDTKAYADLREMLATPGWKTAREALAYRRQTLLEVLATAAPEEIAGLQAECRILRLFLGGHDEVLQFLLPRGAG